MVPLISQISQLALGAGILEIITAGYSKWLIKKGVSISESGGGAEFLFLAGVIFIIAEVFKKGVAIQTENDLTV